MSFPSKSPLLTVATRVSIYILLIISISFATSFVFNRYIKTIAQNIFKSDPTYGLVGGVQTLNPLFTKRGSSEEALARNLFSGLLTYDEQGNLVGDLAESWELRDSAKEIYLVLKQDKYWTDGVKLTSNDVLFTYQLTQQEGYGGPYNSLFDGVEIQAISDFELLFILPATYIPFLDSLRTPILPLHVFGSTDAELVREQTFLRNGPFSASVQDIDTRITKLNDDSKMQVITLSTKDRSVIFQFFEDIESLKSAFEIGDVQTIIGNKSEISASFTDNTKAKLTTVPTVGQQFSLIINTSSISDENTRKAILHAIDNEKLSGSAFLGPYALQSIFWSQEEALRVGFDPEIAKKLLQDKTFSLVTFNTPELEFLAQQIQESLTAAGAVLTIYPNSPEEFAETAAPERKYDMVLIPLEIGREPDMYSFWHSSQVEHPGLNFGKVVSRRVDNALEKGRMNASFDTRKELYNEFQQNLLAIHVVEFLGHPDIQMISYRDQDLPKYVWEYSELWSYLLAER